MILLLANFSNSVLKYLIGIVTILVYASSGYPGFFISFEISSVDARKIRPEKR
jgi:hypothetical protein